MMGVYNRTVQSDTVVVFSPNLWMDCKKVEKQQERRRLTDISNG